MVNLFISMHYITANLSHYDSYIYNIRPCYDALRSININMVTIMINLFISMHYVKAGLSYYDHYIYNIGP